MEGGGDDDHDAAAEVVDSASPALKTMSESVRISLHFSPAPLSGLLKTAALSSYGKCQQLSPFFLLVSSGAQMRTHTLGTDRTEHSFSPTPNDPDPETSMPSPTPPSSTTSLVASQWTSSSSSSAGRLPAAPKQRLSARHADEFMKSISGKKPDKTKVIVSSHNYENTPSVDDLTNLVSKIQSTGAGIVKIATTVKDLTDVSHMFRVMAHCQVPIIGLVMGDRGVISRVLASKFGGYHTFASLEAGKESADGQPTIKDLLEECNFRQVERETQIHGIIGKPVYHSKGPLLYNKAFSSVGLEAVYVHYLVDDHPHFVDVYSSPDFSGFRSNSYLIIV
ncbi:Bifunctional 3-dehydroquinate dehydratase/shikimate dehydrogenase [Nymphaea thermarum]|nr:Bifunctional 3-dehydroquinate dehydratase/shikimate dehydrogenase [Nymphaea thermarum]